MATNKEKALAAAQKHLERGQPDRALAEFARVVHEEPGDTRTWLKMADLYARRGQNEQARDIYLRLGELYVDQGALPKAVTVYKNALKLSPGLAHGHERLAALLEELGQTNEALQHLALAVAAFQKAARPAEALPALRRIVALAPERVVARVQLAESASQAGETQEAIGEFKRAAEFLKAQGRGDEYVRVAERIIFHEPQNFPLARELAAVYIARKNPRLALAKLQVAAKAAPRDPQNIELVALALEQLDPSKALSIWKELAELHDGLGRSGERDGAIRAALALDATDVEARALARQWGVRVAGVPESAVSAPVPMNAVPELQARVPTRKGTPAPMPPPIPVAPRASAEPSGEPSTDPSGSGLSPRPDASRILSEAEVFVKYGLLERAADHLRRLLEQQPAHVEARARLATVLTQLGRAGAAPPIVPAADPLADVVTPPPRATAAVVPDDLLAELEQIDFFVEQSLLDEARQSLTELATRFPNHPLVLAKMREIDAHLEADPTGLDLSPGALPRDEAASAARGDSGPTPAPPVAVMTAGGEADPSTHGDLGIAYKEMGLHDAAIAEFKLLMADETRRVFALTMMGECLEAQGALPDAVVRYKEALNTGGVADAESTQLYYLLGSAFERLGDASEALYFFEKVAKRGGQFRDVARRIEALKPGAAGHP
ncbi:MAG TPA: tetratricopeptide repeat protein [Polyangia bacterium]|nr:tetratricopeptide repeat protein [Polyangia bacterium]